MKTEKTQKKQYRKNVQKFKRYCFNTIKANKEVQKL